MNGDVMGFPAIGKYLAEKGFLLHLEDTGIDGTERWEAWYSRRDYLKRQSCRGLAPEEAIKKAAGLIPVTMLPPDMKVTFKHCAHLLVVRDRERVPLRHGSAPTEICIDCGGYRTVDRWLSSWRPGPVSKEKDLD